LQTRQSHTAFAQLIAPFKTPALAAHYACPVLKNFDKKQVKMLYTFFMKNKRAFTLIELLVVVLIIAILTAVDLPQYRNAVARSQATTVIHMVREIRKSLEEYLLANGKAPLTWSHLSITLPPACDNKTNCVLDGVTYVFTPSDATTYFQARMNKGGYSITFEISSTSKGVNRNWWCLARNENGRKLCSDLSGKSEPHHLNSEGTAAYYLM
jgi:type IV pilus assembly protein PilA